MTSIVDGLRSLGPRRLGLMAGVAVLCLGMLGFLAMSNGDGPMGLLYTDLDLREAGQIVDHLDKAHIPYRTEAGGARVLVPADQVDRARILLAKDGLPSGGSIGYEIFDRSDGLTANSFQQVVTQTRAMEGELERTIRSLQGVRNARVHLVLPHREPFARERQEAQAGIVLSMIGGRRLDPEGIQAVLNLVAAAVPGLKPQNIAIIDSRGTLLARSGEPNAAAAAAQTAEELQHATELRLSRAVEEMLERSLGAGHVRAEAAVDFNFERVQETQERYDPDGQVVRSTQNSTSSNKTTEAANNASVQNNLPNANAADQANGSQEQKQDETTNYEISKTVRTIVREQPQIRRISLAVMVDDQATTDADGKVVRKERSPEELARITALVRTAIGYDKSRGDEVDVVSMRFADTNLGLEAPEPSFWSRLDKADLIRLGEHAFFGLLALATMMFVLRPMALRLALAPAVAGEIQGEAAAGAVAGAEGSIRLEGGNEELVQVGNFEGTMRVSAIKRVAELVEQRPEESVSMLRNWLAEAN